MKDIKKSNGFWFTLKIGDLRILAGDEKLNIHPKPLWELDFTNLCVFTSNPFQWNPTCLQSFWMDFCFQNCNHYIFSHIREQTNSQKRTPNSHICKIFLFPCSVRLPDQQCPVDRRHKKFGHHGHHTITLSLEIFKKTKTVFFSKRILYCFGTSHFLWKSSRSYRKNIARIANAVQVTIWL